MGLRIIFMGTPDFAVPTLRALHAAGQDIVACYSQPPRPAGRRGLELKASPVHQAAEALGIAVHTPISLKSAEEQQRFSALDADVAVVVAYGLLLPQAILDAPRLGCYNGHASLLPRWRGAAPIQRAIMAGDTETGIMVMKMEAGLDTGPVALTARCAIDDTTTAGQLHDTLAQMGSTLMVEAMAALEQGQLGLTPQAIQGVVYADKISKNETRIDWSFPAQKVQRTIMGLSPFPGAWFSLPTVKNELRVKVLASRYIETTNQEAPGTALDDRLTIACEQGAVQLMSLQKAGGKPMDGETFLRGTPITTGTRLD